jgi:hypothetical protein
MMKSIRAILICALALNCGVFVSGCKKSTGPAAQKESKITGSPSDPPVAIRPKWATGQRYLMRMESAQSYQLPNFPGMGRGAGGAGGGTGTNNPPLENHFAQEYALVVTNAADGHRGIEMEILAFEIVAARGDQEFINYDSGNKVAPGNGPMTDLFDKLIGGKIYYLVAPDSTVVRVEGVKELFDRAEPPADPSAEAQAVPGRRGGAMGGAGMLRSAYNEDVFRQMIELAGAPPNSVRIGENWTTTRETSAPIIGKLTITTTNTLRGWQEHEGRRCARVEFTGTVAFGTNTGPLAAFLKLEGGSVTGRYWFAPDLGIPVETIFDQEMTLRMANFGAAQGRRPRDGTNADASTNAAASITAPMRQNISVKLVEVKPVE